jgi:hypothetical protein
MNAWPTEAEAEQQPQNRIRDGFGYFGYHMYDPELDWRKTNDKWDDIKDFKNCGPDRGSIIQPPK